jgi:hypothetical protein
MEINSSLILILFKELEPVVILKFKELPNSDIIPKSERIPPGSLLKIHSNALSLKSTDIHNQCGA